MNIYSISWLALALATGATEPAGAADWSRVTAIEDGSKIRVHTTRGKQTGRFVAASEVDVRLTPAAGPEIVVPRVEVTRVYVQSRSHRLRNLIIGTAVGVAIGAVVYGTIGAW